MINDRVLIRWDFIMFVVCAVLLLPMQLVIGWFAAAAIHELCHVTALKCFKIPICGITFKASGVIIQTDTMQPHEEIICALAGPLGGCVGIIFYRIFPFLAAFSMMQSLYNLLPIYPADGGRVLKGCLFIIFGEEKAILLANIISKITYAFFVLAFLLLCIKYNLSKVSTLIVGIILLIVVFKNTLQWRRKNSTM